MLFWMAASAAFALPELRLVGVYENARGQVALVENVGDQPSRGFYVDIWYHAPAAPVVGDYSDYAAWHPGLAAGEEVYVTVVPYDRWYPEVRQGWTGGWIDVIIDSDRFVAEGNEGNNVSSGLINSLNMAYTVYYGPDGFIDYTIGPYGQPPVWY